MFDSFDHIEQPGISFSLHEVEYTLDEEALSTWLTQVVVSQEQVFGEIEIILVTDSYLHSLNVQYLNHDTLTDIITFQHSEKPISGELYISLERIIDNAETYDVSINQELERVMVHGVLHLCGQGDKSPSDKAEMTRLENLYLDQRPWA